MKVFVTGGTRVLGQATVSRLIERGHTVKGLIHSAESEEVLRRLGAEPVHGDLFDPDSLRKAMGDADAVLHLATRIPPTNKMKQAAAWAENDRIRTEGTRNLVDVALASNVQAFVFPGVTLLYPDRGDAWIDAGATKPAPSEPTVTSLTSEAEVARFAATGRRGVTLRLGPLYGPTSPQTQEILAYARKHIAAIFGPQDAYFSSIWVDDAAAAISTAMERAPSGVYDIVDDEPLTRREFNTAVAEAVGKKRLWQPPAFLARMFAGATLYEMLGRSQRVSNRRFKEATGWTPSVPNARIGWHLLGSQTKSVSDTMKTTPAGTSSF
ncbi:MAG TPA: NAD(P)-dependent oxidoreductase [Thermomicrobiales bacterium]|nr:NAD(P)-dependent oxidoreductase [Thermomicrobiales bacterium]